MVSVDDHGTGFGDLLHVYDLDVAEEDVGGVLGDAFYYAVSVHNINRGDYNELWGR